MSALDLNSLLFSTLKVKTKDTRTFIGQFVCVDKQCNIILSPAEEFLTSFATEDEKPVSVGPNGGREMGMIMIRGQDVEKIELDEKEDRMDIM
jgi:small nuclear ribonucleoprotein (snRNP)-like protein